MGSFGSSSGSTSSNQTTQPYLPPQLRGISSVESNQILSGLRSGDIPSIMSLLMGWPQQGIAPLTPFQMSDINAIQGLATDPFALNPQQGTAEQGYSGILAGPNQYQQEAASIFGNLAQGPNVAVPYGEKVFRDIVSPTLESQAGLSGQGNSGALLESLAKGGEQMALPMAEQGLSLEAGAAQGLAGLGGEVANERLAAAGGEAGVGSQAFNQGMQRLGAALEAAGIPQEQAQRLLDAIFQQQMGRTNAGMGVQSSLLNWLLGLTGQTQTGTQGFGGTNITLGFGPNNSALSGSTPPWWWTGGGKLLGNIV